MASLTMEVRLDELMVPSGLTHLWVSEFKREQVNSFVPSLHQPKRG